MLGSVLGAGASGSGGCWELGREEKWELGWEWRQLLVVLAVGLDAPLSQWEGGGGASTV